MHHFHSTTDEIIVILCVIIWIFVRIKNYICLPHPILFQCMQRALGFCTLVYWWGWGVLVAIERHHCYTQSCFFFNWRGVQQPSVLYWVTITIFYGLVGAASRTRARPVSELQPKGSIIWFADAPPESIQKRMQRQIYKIINLVPSVPSIRSIPLWFFPAAW